MKELGYWATKIKGKILRREKETVIKYFRKAGIKIGERCNIFCNIMTSEPYLIEIGYGVTISGDVVFVTHDNSISKIDRSCPNVFGFIKNGNNCFIGQRATILYGVELADNIIVASGSVVTNSFLKGNVIIGGNPARVISNWDAFLEKGKPYAMSRKVVEEKSMSSPDLFIKREGKS
jgi:acetyltransferase-like isoleucine patch superfamily enzyme